MKPAAKLCYFQQNVWKKWTLWFDCSAPNSTEKRKTLAYKTPSVFYLVSFVSQNNQNQFILKPMIFVLLLLTYYAYNKEKSYEDHVEKWPVSLSMGMSPSGEELWTTGKTTSDIL